MGVKALAWILGLVGGLATAGAARGAEAVDCQKVELDPGAVKERIKHWPGLAPFARWRILRIDLPDCAAAGMVELRLEVAPPDSWSVNRLPYRIWLTVPIDAASGAPGAPAPAAAWRELATGVKRISARVERYEDVQRFIERFGVSSAAIEVVDEKNHLRVTLVADPRAGELAERTPVIQYDESVPERISAYRIPQMDSLPVRRELLRMLEVLSQHHPACRPSWISAQRIATPGNPVAAAPSASSAPPEVVHWSFQLDLKGANCPDHFAAELKPDGVVARMQVGGEAPIAKGDAIDGP
jgi:hypothetical protein